LSLVPAEPPPFRSREQTSNSDAGQFG